MAAFAKSVRAEKALSVSAFCLALSVTALSSSNAEVIPLPGRADDQARRWGRRRSTRCASGGACASRVGAAGRRGHFLP